MAVHDRGFSAYEGELTPEWSRFLILPRYAYREVFRSKLFTGFFFLCFVWPFGNALFVYLHHNSSVLEALQMRPAVKVPGVHLAQSYLFFECELDRIVDGFGENSLVVGRIVEAAVAQDSLRTLERDAQDLIHHAPMLAYLQPWRFASIEQTYRFPLPDGFER